MHVGTQLRLSGLRGKYFYPLSYPSGPSKPIHHSKPLNTLGSSSGQHLIGWVANQGQEKASTRLPVAMSLVSDYCPPHPSYNLQEASV